LGNTLHVVPAGTRDYRRLAERRLPRFLFDYIDGGANDEVTLERNVADFQQIRVRQKVLIDVSKVDTATTLAGEPAAMPLILGPVGMAGMMARRGEVQALRAADAAGVPFTMSTAGVCPLAELRAAARRNFWFQLYMVRDRGAVRALLERASAAGCTTLVFTVDLAALGMRHRDTRNGMTSGTPRARLARAWQIGLRPRWCYDVALRGRPHGLGILAEVVPGAQHLDAVRNWLATQFDASVTWKDIEWLRGIWPGKLILKGLQEVEDGRAAAAVGADGVVVSNHGGRQLDGVASSISKLPGIVAAVGDRLEVFVDGGVRSGLDVLKAVALGARGVLIGRAWIWAVAGAGEAGLIDLLATFRRELEIAMALAGVRRVGEIGRGLID
jgi:L-lactate dehydrogenase (cytochrome)